MSQEQDNINNLKAEHQQWLRHPVTQSIIKQFQKHRETCINDVSQNASNLDLTDSQFRTKAMNIKNTDALLSLLTNTEVFVKKLTETQTKTNQTEQ